MDVAKPPVRWLRAHWDEEDVTFFFEADEDGVVLRQVELRGSDDTPLVAASLVEWPSAERDGLAAVQTYQAKYGALADQPIAGWDADVPHVDIERSAFEEAWRRARAHLERSR